MNHSPSAPYGQRNLELKNDLSQKTYSLRKTSVKYFFNEEILLMEVDMFVQILEVWVL